MNYEEIKSVLKEKINSVKAFAYEDYDKNSLGLGDILEIHQYGGEGMGDHWESVKYFKDHNVYIKVTGFYSSYNGTDFYDGWDRLSCVEPKQKTVTVYE